MRTVFIDTMTRPRELFLPEIHADLDWRGRVHPLIHIIMHGEPENDFSERMFRYNVRACDRYNRAVISLAVLSDERLDWRPAGFVRERLAERQE